MAFTSAKMGLRIWNLLTDLYDHAQLADNWAKVDYHDHSPGKGVQIPTEGLADGAVTSVKLDAATDPSGAYLSAKPLLRVGGTLVGGSAAATMVLRQDQGAVTAVPVAVSNNVWYLDPSDWTASGRTVNWRLRGTLITNAVAPTATYAFNLHPIATWGGASGATPTAATLGTVSASTPTIIAPAAAGPATPVSVDFVAPAAGWYAITVTQTGASAANANVAFFASLFARQL